MTQGCKMQIERTKGYELQLVMTVVAGCQWHRATVVLKSQQPVRFCCQGHEESNIMSMTPCRHFGFRVTCPALRCSDSGQFFPPILCKLPSNFIFSKDSSLWELFSQCITECMLVNFDRDKKKKKKKWAHLQSVCYLKVMNSVQFLFVDSSPL